MQKKPIKIIILLTFLSLACIPLTTATTLYTVTDHDLITTLTSTDFSITPATANSTIHINYEFVGGATMLFWQLETATTDSTGKLIQVTVEKEINDYYTITLSQRNNFYPITGAEIIETYYSTLASGEIAVYIDRVNQNISLYRVNTNWAFIDSMDIESVIQTETFTHIHALSYTVSHSLTSITITDTLLPELPLPQDESIISVLVHGFGNYNYNGTAPYYSGDLLVFTMNPAQGWEFTNITHTWTVEGGGSATETDNPRTFLLAPEINTFDIYFTNIDPNYLYPTATPTAQPTSTPNPQITEFETNFFNYLAPLLFLMAPAAAGAIILGKWNAAIWGFIAGLNIGAILCYLYIDGFGIWAVILVAIIDAIMLFVGARGSN